MSREEAIEILSDMRAEYNLFGDEEEATRYHVLSWAIQAMKATQPWIPVSESLPKIGEHYVSEPCIVYCSNGAYGFAELEANIFGQVGWNCERDDEYHEPLGEVLAWMPLPGPWIGEEDEADA